jgi:LacI family transcriptional regulator
MTIKELAQELNISTTTVSRVLTGQEKKYRISSKTALRVKDGARKHRFEPNQIARNLRLQETNTIGLIIPDISNPFFANLARTVEIELRKRNKMILLCDTKDETFLEEESLNLLLGRKVDGLLVAPVGKKCDHLIKNSKVPLVLIDRYFKDQTIPFVTADNFQGAYSATEFLINKGHQNIACIQGLGHTSVNENRILGYRRAMEGHKIPNKFIQISGSGYSIENGYGSTQELLLKKNRPTAIFALNNQIALGAMKAIKEAGLNIPEDISLVAFDEQPYFELLSPALTAIQQPMQDIGKVAVETLFRLMAGENVKNQMLVPNFIERGSVKSISL